MALGILVLLWMLFTTTYLYIVWAIRPDPMILYHFLMVLYILKLYVLVMCNLYFICKCIILYARSLNHMMKSIFITRLDDIYFSILIFMLRIVVSVVMVRMIWLWT